MRIAVTEDACPVRSPATNYRSRKPVLPTTADPLPDGARDPGSRSPPKPLLDGTLLLPPTASRGHALFLRSRSSRNCFSQINPIAKNKTVQICWAETRTSSLTPMTPMLIRSMSVETANCPPDLFKLFAASTKFRSQINKKNAVPLTPICNRSSRTPLCALVIPNPNPTSREISKDLAFNGDQNAQNPQPNIGLSLIASMT